MPIDAVFTWVDGSDAAHAAKRRHYLHSNYNGRILSNAAAATRFNEVGEIWYAIHLARKHAPWLRTIHIVTDEQVPEWLDDDAIARLGVNIVDHRVLFRGFQEFLPTFSSRSIEAMVDRIPGLAENFLYLNDDFFIVKPVSPDDYFRGGATVVRGYWTWRNRYLAFVERKIRIIGGQGDVLEALVGLRPEASVLGGARYFRVAHAPYAVERSRFTRCFDDDRLLTDTIKYRFRSSDQIWPIGFYTNSILRDGGAHIHRPDWGYLSATRMRSDVLSYLRSVASKSAVKHLCIQSLDQFPEYDKRICLEYLKSLTDEDS